VHLVEPLAEAAGRYRQPDPHREPAFGLRDWQSAPLSQLAWAVDRQGCPPRRPSFALAQIAPGDLDIAVIGQLAPAQFPLGGKLETGPPEVVSLQAAFRGHRAIEQALKDLARHARHALVFTNADAELDRLPIGVPAHVLGEDEEHGSHLRFRAIP
jgi:hypothetical protein